MSRGSRIIRTITSTGSTRLNQCYALASHQAPGVPKSHGLDIRPETPILSPQRLSSTDYRGARSNYIAKPMSARASIDLLRQFSDPARKEAVRPERKVTKGESP